MLIICPAERAKPEVWRFFSNFFCLIDTGASIGIEWPPMRDILKKIIAHKTTEVEKAKGSITALETELQTLQKKEAALKDTLQKSKPAVAGKEEKEKEAAGKEKPPVPKGEPEKKDKGNAAGTKSPPKKKLIIPKEDGSKGGKKNV